MSFTPQQKEAIKKRAQELLATGMSTGAAAQQAYAEISKDTTIFPTPKTEAIQKAELESRQKVQEIERTRSGFVDQRASVLEKEGLEPPIARSRAEQEFESTYLKPTVTPYGELKERAATKPFGIDITAAPPTSITQEPGTLETALRPQTTLPKSAIAPEKERAKEPGYVGLIGGGPDYNKINQKLLKDGLTPQQAANQIAALQSAYNINLLERKKTYQENKKLLPDTFLNDVWEQTVKNIEEVPYILENKKEYQTDYKPSGPQDPLFLAFSKQVKEGEGVPRLLKDQAAYISSLATADRKAVEKRIADEYKDKPLVVTETESVEGIRGATPRSVTRELVGAEKEAEIARRAASEVEIPWWTDSEEVYKRLKEPWKLTKPGIFQEETAFGTQRETNLGWLVRSAMAPINAVAGAVFPVVFTGADKETRDAVEEARRRVRPEAYKDSPILLNIAEGRGFVGEAAELSKITGLDTEKIYGLPITYGDVYKMGAFAADILDPSMDIVSAAARGGKTAVGAARAAKIAGLKSPKTFGTAEGLKEAGRAVVFENPALRTMNEIASKVKVPKLEPGDVRLAISQKLSDEAANALGTGRFRQPDVDSMRRSPVLREVNDVLQKLDNTVGNYTYGGIGLTKEELTKAVGEAITVNPSLAPADIYAKKLIDELSTNDELYKATQKAIINNAIRESVFKSTKDSILNSGIVAVTRKIFATKDTATKILNDYVKSDFSNKIKQITLGKELVPFKQDIVSVAKPGLGTEVVKEGYKITPDDNKFIEKELQRLLNKGLINSQDLLTILRNSSKGLLSTEDVRKLIDANIEEVASKYNIVKSSDVAQLNPIVSKEILKPLEIRDFSAPSFRNWFISKGGGEIPRQPLTAAQEAFKDEVIGRVSNLDKKLRSDMQKLTSDNNFRALYGIPAINERKLTREQLIGFLITRDMSKEKISEILKLAIDKVFFQEKYVNDLFDIFTGVKLSQSTDIWSNTGREELMKLIEESATNVFINSGKFVEELAKLITKAKNLTKEVGATKIPPSEIKSPKGDFGPQTIIASYYEAESSRIIQEALAKIVTNDLEVVRSPSLYNAGWKLKLKPVQTNDFVVDYVRMLLTNPQTSGMRSIDIFQSLAPPALRNVDWRQGKELVEFITEVDGVARKILRNNKFDAIRNPVDEIVDIASKALRDPSFDDTVNAIIGKEVADQIRKSLSTGNSNSIQAQLSKMISESYKDPTAMSIINKISDSLLSAFYTLVLTAAPRFHGANIIGAPSTIYSTTGRLLNPKSVLEAFSVLKNADTSTGAKIIVRDPAGREYTANELYRQIVDRGGESVFSANLPGFAGRTAKAAIEIGAAGKAYRIADWLLSTPDKEDSVFRLAVAISALKEGRTIDDAVSLAKASLYDKGTISKSEENIQKLLLFYTFTRNNLVNLMKNLSKPEGWKRIINTAKFKRGIESFTVDPEEQKYAPETAATRVLLGKMGTKDVGEKGIVLASPSDSTLSALELLINLISGDIVEVASGMMKPGQSMLFKESTENTLEKIPAEHLAIYQMLSDTTGASLSDILGAMTGEDIIPVRSREPDAIDGYIYPILSESARKRYQLAINVLGYIGIGRIINDYPNIAGAPGTKSQISFTGEPAGTLGKIGYNIGFVTPLKTLSGEQQRLKNLIVQNAEGRKMLKDIDDIMLKGEIAPVTGDEAGYGERIEKGKRGRAEGKMGIDELKREKLRLKSEIQGIVQQIRLDPARERRGIYMQEINKRRDRLKEISKLEKQAQ